MRTPTVTLLPRASLLVALWLVSASALAATVYKWVDEKGVTHYSDQPHAQAKEMDVQAAQSYSSAATAAPAASASTASAAAGPRYATCEIYRPENDEVFLNTNTITAKIRLEPQLLRGDQVALALDGKRLMSLPAVGTDFVISDIERGTHSLLLVVEDSQRKVLCTSTAVTFHVRQPSTQAPVKALRPRF